MRFLSSLGGALARASKFIRRDKKAAAGSIILFVLLLITAFPSWFAPDNPSAEIYTPGVGLSWSHLLGTTSFGQDVFSQPVSYTHLDVYKRQGEKGRSGGDSSGRWNLSTARLYQCPCWKGPRGSCPIP